MHVWIMVETGARAGESACGNAAAMLSLTNIKLRF